MTVFHRRLVAALVAAVLAGGVSLLAAPSASAAAPDCSAVPLCGWGINSSGQLGNGSVVDTPSPTPAPGPTDVTSLAAGLMHTLALRTDGTVWSWGYDGAGELGNNVTSGSTVSTPTAVAGLTGVVQVAAGQNFSAAVKGDGTVWTWGNNNHGQLGIGRTGWGAGVPQRVPNLTDVVAVSEKYGHTLAVRRDGSVWAWGDNSNGQIGSTTPGDVVTPVRVPGVSGAVGVAAGSYASYALRSDGTVWAWGARGMTGNGAYGSADPAPPAVVRGLTGVRSVVAGSDFTLALRSDDTVVSWGYNNGGQLGNGTTDGSGTPVAVTGLVGAVAVAGGWGHAAALRADGRVMTWGTTSQGGLGTGQSRQYAPVLVPGVGSAVTVAAGSDFTLTASNVGGSTIRPTFSENYAGYVAEGTGFTLVQGSWTVPSVDCTAAGAMSIWVGIDGWRSRNLVQAGSEAVCAKAGAQPSYDVFTEQLPAFATLQGSVKPGDVVAVGIRYYPNSKKNVTALYVNSTLVKSLTQDNPTAEQVSAECIVEAPRSGSALVPLARFGTATFSSCRAATGGASTGPQIATVRQAGVAVSRVDMRRGTLVKATTSTAPGAGAPWSVAWKAAG